MHLRYFGVVMRDNGTCLEKDQVHYWEQDNDQDYCRLIT